MSHSASIEGNISFVPRAEPPTDVPTEALTIAPPTEAPTADPPTNAPTDASPTDAPTAGPPTKQTDASPTDAPTAEPPTYAPTMADVDGIELLPLPSAPERILDEHEEHKEAATLHAASVEAHINFASGPLDDVPGACALPEACLPGECGIELLPLPSAPKRILDERAEFVPLKA